jgi:hypothetical protein
MLLWLECADGTRAKVDRFPSETTLSRMVNDTLIWIKSNPATKLNFDTCDAWMGRKISPNHLYYTQEWIVADSSGG